VRFASGEGDGLCIAEGVERMESGKLSPILGEGISDLEPVEASLSEEAASGEDIERV